MLINSSYFIGEINIPNTGYEDVQSQIDALIEAHEFVFLKRLLGYELYKKFQESVLSGEPEQRFLDLLFGFEFTHNGITRKFEGLISLNSIEPKVLVGVEKDIYFKVGAAGGPADGSDEYINPLLAGKKYRVIQRAFGPLVPDGNNPEIEIIPTGGFKLLNGVTFSSDDTFIVQIIGVYIDSPNTEVVQYPQSPLADFVYFHWHRNNHTQTTGLGEAVTGSINASNAMPSNKMVYAWNRMVDRLHPLAISLVNDCAKWPEWQKHDCKDKFYSLLTKINVWGI